MRSQGAYHQHEPREKQPAGRGAQAASLLLIITGAFYGAWWLLGIGAWDLIAAGLTEMIRRP